MVTFKFLSNQYSGNPASPKIIQTILKKHFHEEINIFYTGNIQIDSS